MNITPINPEDPRIKSKYTELELAIKYINSKIIEQEFHEQINPVPHFYAIILKPFDIYTPVLDEVVKEFKKIGWLCYWDRVYDIRGPHDCFYVHKNHFK